VLNLDCEANDLRLKRQKAADAVSYHNANANTNVTQRKIIIKF